jgi:hypothetical protein
MSALVWRNTGEAGAASAEFGEFNVEGVTPVRAAVPVSRRSWQLAMWQPGKLAWR